MGTPQSRPEPAQRAIAAVTYVVLFVLGGVPQYLWHRAVGQAGVFQEDWIRLV